MPTIEIAVENKIARQTNDEIYICGNSDFVVVFDFDSEWEAYDAKTARLKYYDNRYQDVLFVGNEFSLPAISNTNHIQIGVYAGDLHTTTPAVVMAKKSILCGDSTHEDPPEDVYNQLMELLEYGVSEEQIEAVVEKYMEEHQLEVYEAGDNISITDGVISVTTTNDAEADNTLPITSAGVHTQIGNINVLLATI